MNKKRREIYGEIHRKVYGFKTKSEHGFTPAELEELVKNYPDINMDKFNDALCGITCMMEEGEIITYHCDVENAIRCGIENRDLNVFEWD